MAKTLLDLAKRMQTLANTIDDQASELSVQVATAIHNSVVRDTPVDTSRALSNWVVTIGNRFSGELAPYYLGSKGSTRGSSMQEALSAAALVLKTKRPGQAIWISNNVSYIGDLNDGTSTQQPRGFVERAAVIGRRVVISYRFKL